MNLFKQLLNDNGPQEWTIALLAIATCMLGLHTVRRLALERLRKRLSAGNDGPIALLVDLLAATRVLLAAAIALYIATQLLELPASFDKAIDRAFVALLVLQAGMWANRGLDFFLKRRFGGSESGDEGAREMTRSLLSFIGRVVLWAVVLLLILDNMGFNVTALVASLGIGGVAVALAVQNILGDLFASLSIAIDKPFVIGDFIIVDDLMGTVEHVGLKTTRIRSLGGEQIVFSNNDLLGSRIRNYKRMQERRAVFAVGVTYDTRAAQLEEIPGVIREAVEAQPGVRFDRAHFKAFGPSSLDFEVVYYVEEPDIVRYMDAQQAINLRLVREFAARGIQFAFPTRTLHLNGGVRLLREGGDEGLETPAARARKAA
ncbi:mechanosensitive ion channel family protein [Aromatoleum toluclasticum]|uniref:mechanosensitive ion channel family protein n=1 Tax=Aromatoleum toluclasticum TaxID=92003 RepID=UPI001D18F25E|nr:mechanosensitive ion channel family protein [Aromatoleum toluclasticum]MCC4115871.1 mechanosensitive ion channel family protein [Aromatoleum toluclasticum]